MSESTDPVDPTAPTAADPQPDPSAADPAAPERDLAADVEKWKKLSRENEARAKANAAAARELAELKEAQKTEAEKLADRLTAAENRAKTATAMAVAARVQASATGRFTDPQDAVDELSRRGADFLDDAGQVNSDAIEAALVDLLERKPHWGIQSGPRTPRPDPSQGPRPGGTVGIEERIREATAKGDWKTVLSLQNSKLASATQPK